MSTVTLFGASLGRRITCVASTAMIAARESTVKARTDAKNDLQVHDCRRIWSKMNASRGASCSEKNANAFGQVFVVPAQRKPLLGQSTGLNTDEALVD